jgi:hypothetical protein
VGDAIADAGRRRAFATWLEGGAVSQKRADALACLEAAGHGGGAGREPPEMVNTCFVETLAGACGVDPAAIRP